MGWSRGRSARCLESIQRSKKNSCSEHCAFGPQLPSWTPYHGCIKVSFEAYWYIEEVTYKKAAQVRYRPFLKSLAAIIFFGSYIC